MKLLLHPNLRSSFLFVFLIFIFLTASRNAVALEPQVFLGADLIFEEQYQEVLKGKRVGLITNHTGVNRNLVSTINQFKQKQSELGFTLKAFFAPEHGLFGEGYAGQKMTSFETEEGIPVYSLHGATRRPTKKMLSEIDLLVFDIQDIGSRSYTFACTLFYAMEEAAKENVQVVVLDRPNPMGGVVVDGPMLEEEFRSFVGYINVPYCHGMTIGELATFFNEEYKVGCDLQVIPMRGWKRSMSFSDTGLVWIPTSPNIPESESCYFYPTTGFMGEISFVSIGIGYTLPFKVVGAPWIKGEKFAALLNQAKLPGCKFVPLRFQPFSGLFSKASCQGVLIIVQDEAKYLPVTTQYLILATLKRHYPKECAKALKASEKRQDFFCKITGTKKIYQLLLKEKPTLQEFRAVHKKERAEFLKLRSKYLLPNYP